MQLCHQTIVRSCGVRGCELIRPLMSKRSEGENLRLIEFSLFESRDVFRMIANLYAHLGLGVEDLQELLERISANYFRLTRFSQGICLCTEPLKIKFFVREVLEQLLCVPEVCAYLKACRPRRSFSGLMEKHAGHPACHADGHRQEQHERQCHRVPTRPNAFDFLPVLKGGDSLNHAVSWFKGGSH